mmetsp:Transcript_37508/g.120324  ORF Transcript_37508/g.120324 Transcript_37508/m.120324 type:complete len:208 (+) Transcript_37508:2074-2697(+)
MILFMVSVKERGLLLLLSYRQEDGILGGVESFFGLYAVDDPGGRDEVVFASLLGDLGPNLVRRKGLADDVGDSFPFENVDDGTAVGKDHPLELRCLGLRMAVDPDRQPDEQARLSRRPQLLRELLPLLLLVRLEGPIVRLVLEALLKEETPLGQRHPRRTARRRPERVLEHRLRCPAAHSKGDRRWAHHERIVDDGLVSGRGVLRGQ